MPVAKQEGPVHEMADTGELVRGDDRRDAALRPLMYGVSDWRGSAWMRTTVDEQNVARLGHGGPNVRRGGDTQKSRALPVFDRTRVDATEAGQALEKRGGAGTTSAEDGDALPFVHLEAGGTQHPDPRRATGDAGSVALPQSVGA